MVAEWKIFAVRDIFYAQDQKPSAMIVHKIIADKVDNKSFNSTSIICHLVSSLRLEASTNTRNKYWCPIIKKNIYKSL